MAEASQENGTLDRKSRIELLELIFRLIKENSFDEIKRIFEFLQFQHCITILNSSIHGYTPIYVAVNHNKMKIMLYFLDCSILQGHREMCERWKTCRHPLSIAILLGHQDLVELLLLHLYNIHDNINGSHSPLMMATLFGKLDSVKMILAMGADINQPCFQGRTPLMESTSDREICYFLLSNGANIFQADDEGFTALHLAVIRRHTESIDLLVDSGADVRIRNHEGLSPLLLACMYLNKPLVIELIKHPTYYAFEKIEALEILNACFVCNETAFILVWTKALQLRRAKNLPKNSQIPVQEILDFSREFTTEADLELIQDDPLLLAYQGILVVERILGRCNRLYFRLLLETALIAKKKRRMSKLRQIINYIQQNFQESSICFVDSNMRFFRILFFEVCKNGNPKNVFEYGGFTIFKMIADVAVKKWVLVKDNVSINPFFIDSNYSELIDTFMYMTAITKTNKFSLKRISLFKEVVSKVVKEDPRVRLNQSLLHLAIKMMNATPWGSIDVVKLLLESGADVNSRDYFRRTPLMYALKHVPEYNLNDVLELLLGYGGHPDCRNSEGLTVLNDTNWGRSMIPLTAPRSLQCLAIEVILDNEIAYQGRLSESAENVVNFHK